MASPLAMWSCRAAATACHEYACIARAALAPLPPEHAEQFVQIDILKSGAAARPCAAPEAGETAGPRARPEMKD